MWHLDNLDERDDPCQTVWDLPHFSPRTLVLALVFGTEVRSGTKRLPVNQPGTGRGGLKTTRRGPFRKGKETRKIQVPLTNGSFYIGSLHFRLTWNKGTSK